MAEPQSLKRTYFVSWISFATRRPDSTHFTLESSNRGLKLLSRSTLPTLVKEGSPSDHQLLPCPVFQLHPECLDGDKYCVIAVGFITIKNISSFKSYYLRSSGSNFTLSRRSEIICFSSISQEPESDDTESPLTLSPLNPTAPCITGENTRSGFEIKQTVMHDHLQTFGPGRPIGPSMPGSP